MNPQPSPATSGADADAFRAVMQRHGAAVTVITALLDGRFHGVTATAFCSVSADPPSVLVCVNRSASAHRAFVSARHFCVNLLAADQTELAQRFSTNDEAVRRRRFDDLRLGTLVTGAPTLAGALGHIDCNVVSVMECKTHTVFIGLAVGISTRADDAAPLLYMARHYGSFAPLPPPDLGLVRAG